VKDPRAQLWAAGLIETEDYKSLNDTARNKPRKSQTPGHLTGWLQVIFQKENQSNIK